MSIWIAPYALNLITIFLVYRGLFELTRFLYRRNVFWAVSFTVFLSPFAYVLVQVRSPLELMWVLLLTPFYGVAVLSVLFTEWMIRYYGMMYSVLALLHFLFSRRRAPSLIPGEYKSHRVFWDQRVGISVVSAETRLKNLVFQAKDSVLDGAKKYWNFVLVGVLAASVATTLVGNPKPVLRDPTYGEALRFVAVDQTNLNWYAEDRQTCVKFAEDFKNNALKAGYNCGYVLVYFPDKSHALNAFNTADKGIIFIEPQTDETVTLAIGQPYWNRAEYEPPGYNDTILGYTITW